MELKYQFAIYIAIPIILILIIFRFKRKENYKNGTKVANTQLVKSLPYYKEIIRKYKFMIIACEILAFISIGAISVLFASPQEVSEIKDEKYLRDIVLCMDVSTSVNELNLELVENMKEKIKTLDGERVGVTIFNTTPVAVAPLTDDYDYVIDVLNNIEKCIKIFEGSLPYDRKYSNYNFNGTLEDNENRGSSLIGDGLMSSANNLVNAEKGTPEERTMIIIFSTDNDLQGKEAFTLSQAATFCKKNNITVFGICPSFSAQDKKASMKAAVEKTGGSFYNFTTGSTLDDIMKEIEKEGKSLVKVETKVRKTVKPEIPFIVLIISVFSLIVINRVVNL